MSIETNHYFSGKKCYFFDASATRQFIQFLMGKAEVIAPHRKGENSFSYEVVANPAEVVLDYPRTIQPLKKYFLPPRETLLTFDRVKNQFNEAITEAKERIFFGVHSYEMQGVLRLDYSFKRGNPESNYLTRREKSRFIGISYTPDKYHFSKAVGIDIEQSGGFCLFLDAVTNGFNVYVIDTEGQKLIDEAKIGHAQNAPTTIAERSFKNKIKLHFNRLPQVFDHVYKSKVWDGVAQRCVGCGTCNLLCSTCYCFDVRDEIELDATHGKRERFWDGCMLNPFAEVAGGENFREKLSNRTRHRLYRKFKYISQHSGELHCVGCGRCSKFCPADISLVEIVNQLIDDYAEMQKK
jgi:sulfhydrogenase subunit beta (sulfur reductase)